jgi:hypothetical protein
MEDLANVAVSALLEDFRARWQELLNYESEVSTWSTLYYTAFLLTIGWILGRKRDEVDSLFRTHTGITPFLVLSIALINAVYILAIAFKGYRIQQNALYLYDVVGKRITRITGEPFNTWDDWRRDHLSRTGTGTYYSYYLLVSVLPFLVSGLILGAYRHYEKPWKGKWREKRNFYFYFVASINGLALILSLLLSLGTFSSWRDVRQKDDTYSPNAKLLSLREQTATHEALKALWKVNAATETGVEYQPYISLTIDARAEANEAQALLPDGSLKNEINLATEAYADGKWAWDLALKSNGQLNTTDPIVESWKQKYALPPDLANTPQIDREAMLKAMWTNARAHIQSASTLVRDYTNSK